MQALNLKLINQLNNGLAIYHDYASDIRIIPSINIMVFLAWLIQASACKKTILISFTEVAVLTFPEESS